MWQTIAILSDAFHGAAVGCTAKAMAAGSSFTWAHRPHCWFTQIPTYSCVLQWLPGILHTHHRSAVELPLILTSVFFQFTLGRGRRTREKTDVGKKVALA